MRERYEGPKPTLKDQIYSGAILKDMYHKPKPVGPNADNLPDYDNKRFQQSIQDRQKEIEERIRTEG
jgi:hypothetical protein